jgi:hypothetical protein
MDGGRVSSSPASVVILINLCYFYHGHICVHRHVVNVPNK